MPGFLKEAQERTGHYYTELFLCSTNIETFITAQQSKNVLHQNCTRKEKHSRTPVTAGEEAAGGKNNQPAEKYAHEERM